MLVLQKVAHFFPLDAPGQPENPHCPLHRAFLPFSARGRVLPLIFVSLVGPRPFLAFPFLDPFLGLLDHGNALLEDGSGACDQFGAVFSLDVSSLLDEVECVGVVLEANRKGQLLAVFS